MGSLRALVRTHGLAALWLLVAVLAVRVIVPTGYMFSWTASGLSVEICDAQLSAPAGAPMRHQMAMMAHHADHGAPGKKQAGDEMPCAFAALGLHAMGGADPALLAAAILFIFATVAFGRAAQGQGVRAPAFLRPPLRGPPARR